MRQKKTNPEFKASVKKRSWKEEFQANWQLYVLLIVPVTYVLIFMYIPMFGAQIAFRDYLPATGIWESEWVGLRHFKRFFNNPQCWAIIKNTFAISLYTQLLNIPLPIILAISFDYARGKYFKKTVQTVTFLPHFLSTVIVVSMMNLIFDNRVGVVNNIIEFLFGTKVNFLGNPKFFRSMFVWSGIWQNLGWSSILYISALSGVDTQIHEAAIIDGANKLRRIWHIDLTAIRPTIAIMVIRSTGALLSVGFDKAFLMQNPLNLQYSEVLSTYEYKMGAAGMVPNYSYASAIGLMLSVVALVMTVTTNKISNKLAGIGLW